MRAMNAPKLSPDELHRLAEAWFAEAREKSAQDLAEVEAWKKELHKWTGFGSSGDSGTWSDSGGGGDGGGGD